MVVNTRAQKEFNKKDVNKVNFPCGLVECGKEVMNEGIRCDICEKWYHQSCSKLIVQAFQLYVVHSILKWVCQECTTKCKESGKVGARETMEINDVTTEADSQRKEDSPPPRDKENRVDDFEKDESRKNGFEDSRSEDNHERNLTEEAADRTVINRMGDVISVSVGIPVSRMKKARANIKEKKRPSKGRMATAARFNEMRKGLNNDIVEDLRDTCNRIYKKLEEQEVAIGVLREDKMELRKDLERLKKNGDLALGRNRNVVIKGIPEPYMGAARHREKYMKEHLLTLLRQVNIPEHVGVKRILRLGRWMREMNGVELRPRPVLVEFANPRHRDRFLTEAGKVKRWSMGKIIVQPDDSANWGREVHRNVRELRGIELVQLKSPIVKETMLEGIGGKKLLQGMQKSLEGEVQSTVSRGECATGVGANKTRELGISQSITTETEVSKPKGCEKDTKERMRGSSIRNWCPTSTPKRGCELSFKGDRNPIPQNRNEGKIIMTRQNQKNGPRSRI